MSLELTEEIKKPAAWSDMSLTEIGAELLNIIPYDRLMKWEEEVLPEGTSVRELVEECRDAEQRLRSKVSPLISVLVLAIITSLFGSVWAFVGNQQSKVAIILLCACLVCLLICIWFGWRDPFKPKVERMMYRKKIMLGKLRDDALLVNPRLGLPAELWIKKKMFDLQSIKFWLSRLNQPTYDQVRAAAERFGFKIG